MPALSLLNNLENHIMQITQTCQVVLLRRSENEKTPLVVMPHEIEVLKALHGEDNIIETDDKPPVESVEFYPSDEYARLQGLYIGNDRVPNPVREGVGTLDEFVSSFENFGGSVDDELKLQLIEEAKSLGIKATKNWGIEKLETEIAAAKAEGGNE